MPQQHIGIVQNLQTELTDSLVRKSLYHTLFTSESIVFRVNWKITGRYTSMVLDFEKLKEPSVLLRHILMLSTLWKILQKLQDMLLATLPNNI